MTVDDGPTATTAVGRRPPGPRAVKPLRPLVAAACGAGYLVAGEWLIRRLFAVYGPVVSIPLPGIPVVLIKDPELVKQVFTEKPDILLGGRGVRPSALIRRDGESVQRALQRAIAAAPGPVAALEAWLDGVLDVFYEPRKATRTALFITSEARSAYRNNVEILEMRWLLSEPLIKVLRGGHRAGAMNSPKPQADAVTLFAVVSSAATAPHAYPRSRKAARAQAIRFIWPALGISDAGGRNRRSGQTRQQHAP